MKYDWLTKEEINFRLWSLMIINIMLLILIIVKN